MTWTMRFVGYPADVDPDEIACIAEDVGVTVRQAASIARLTKIDYFGWPPTLSDTEKAQRSAKTVGDCIVYSFPAARIVRNPEPPAAA